MLAPGKLICLDAEMADGRELLELSIYDGAEEEVYHSYFNPEREDWDVSLHHITPEMVADSPKAASCAPEIAKIVRESDVVLGCAVQNDLAQLSAIGVTLGERHEVVDIQYLDFYVSGGRADRLYQAASLVSLAEKYGVDYTEEIAHGASADTLATLRVFYAIMDKWFQADSRCDLGRTVSAAVELQRATGDELAKGYVVLHKSDYGYKIVTRHFPPKETEETVAWIAVEDRHIAEYELMRHFSHRQATAQGRYNLRAADIKYFKSYKCRRDRSRSEMCRAMLRGLKRNMVL